MPRLLDRNRQIPHGLKFFEPSTKWSAPDWASFETIVDLLIQHRRANPYHAKKNNWAMDRLSVSDEVDEYNAAICAAHGWNNFISQGGNAPPKSKRPWLEGVNRVAAGAKTISEMFGREGPIRDVALATKRAAICVECPMLDKGDWTRFFTVPASELMRSILGAFKDLDLKTEHDEKLGVCTACECPMKLKVWARLSHINQHLPAESRAKLDPGCWILSESEPKTT